MSLVDLVKTGAKIAFNAAGDALHVLQYEVSTGQSYDPVTGVVASSAQTKTVRGLQSSISRKQMDLQVVRDGQAGPLKYTILKSEVGQVPKTSDVFSHNGRKFVIKYVEPADPTGELYDIIYSS